MRLPRSPADAAILSIFLSPLLSAAGAGGSHSCDFIRVEQKDFNLEELGGPRSVMHSYNGHNTTYTVDICKPLGKVKDLPKEEQCPNGTRVCAIKRLVRNESDIFEDYTPIAGELKGMGGKDMNARWERLKTSSSPEDAKKEGLRVELNGGFKILESGASRDQKAIIEFICADRSGLENLYEPEDKYTEKVKREEDNGAGDDLGPDDPSLQFIEYDERSGDVDILRLKWFTRHACEGSKEKEDAEKAGRWGFFTWFILIAFLSTATYLIFGSWLNYNRYGARGWDLLPHGDTIRDVPYLFKDWMRRVLNTLQGGGSRGGYAAV